MLNNSPIKNLEVNDIPNEEKAKKLSRHNYYIYLNSKKKIEYLLYNNKHTDRNYKSPDFIKHFTHMGLGSRQVNIELNDGWLIGFDKGEWGGNLIWCNKNGTNWKKILTGNIKDIIKVKNNYFIIEGSTRSPYSKGHVIKLIRNKKNWETQDKIEISQAPYTAALNKKNELIIVTYKDIIKVDTEFKVKTLSTNHIWKYGLYPNSSIIDNNNFLYIGMLGGILKLDLKNINQNKEWLTEKKL